MRIYVPPGVGLGDAEISVMRRLSRPSLEVIVGELGNPVSYSTVRRVLRADDPEREIAAQVAVEIDRAVSAIHSLRMAGIGDDEYDDMELADAGFGGFFKKIGKAIKKVAKKVVAVHKAVFNKTVKPVIKATIKVAKKSVEITKKAVTKSIALHKMVAKKIGKAIKPYIPIIIGVVGAVLAPFTGGASLAAAAALNAAYQIAMKAKEAKALKKANKKEAAAVQAEVDQSTEDLKKQLDDLFAQNPEIFAAAGITKATWDGMSIEQKLAVIDKINKGEMPSTPDNTQTAAEDQGITPPPDSGATWQDAIKDSPIISQWQEAAGDSDAATAGVQTPTGTYDVYVEGQKVGSAATLEEASALMVKSAKAGDRIEMRLNGRSLGLKVVTAGGGVIAIPDDQAASVMAMSRADLNALLAKASQSAGGAAPSSGGFSPAWLLAIPAAFLFVKAKAA
jgi:hypothetical protein